MAKKNKQTDIEDINLQTASEPTGGDKFKYIYTRKAVERKVQRRRLATALLVFVLIAILVVGAIYGILSFIDFQSFRISVDGSSQNILSLSRDFDFTKPTSSLSTNGPDKLNNTTLDRIPLQMIMATDGTYGQNDDDYIANSFYIINWTDERQLYREKITITNTYRGLEQCVRVLVVKQESVLDPNTGKWTLDGCKTTYTCYAAAKQTENEIGEYQEQVAYLLDESGLDALSLYVIHDTPDGGNQYDIVSGIARYDVDPKDYWYCQSFFAANSGVVVDTTFFPIEPKQKIRYTIVAWIEGSDPDTTNDKLGGKVTMDVKFTTKQA